MDRFCPCFPKENDTDLGEYKISEKQNPQQNLREGYQIGA